VFPSVLWCWLRDGKAVSPTKKRVRLLAKGSVPEQMVEENQLGTGYPGSTWKTAVEMEVRSLLGTGDGHCWRAGIS